jgi:FkbM family methyltransferase
MLQRHRSTRTEIKRTMQRGFHTFGLHLGKYPPVDSLAHHLKTLFAHLGVNCLFDVGAHEGEYYRFVRELGYQGKIVSFEPVKSTFRTMVNGVHGDHDWQALNIALGRTEVAQTIHLYQGTVFNSFLLSNQYANERFGEMTHEVGSETVSVRRLDAIFPDCVRGVEQPRVFLKMDTQGWDLEVLEGATGCLDQIVAIQTELAVKPTYQGMPTLPEALVRLNGLGFELTGMFPVARDLDNLRVVEFDCVLRRIAPLPP